MEGNVIYKLTDVWMETMNHFKWELKKWYEVSGEGELCGPGFLHAYTNPYLAIFLNPIHAKFCYPRLFKGYGDGVFKNDVGLKVGYSKMCIVEELVPKNFSVEERIEIAIRCAMEVCYDPEFQHWANLWINKQRSYYYSIQVKNFLLKKAEKFRYGVYSHSLSWDNTEEYKYRCAKTAVDSAIEYMNNLSDRYYHLSRCATVSAWSVRLKKDLDLVGIIKVVIDNKEEINNFKNQKTTKNYF